MANDESAQQQSTVVASYPTRHDAEMARDYLDEVGISASIRVDDAGGMHPELQGIHGVHLVVLGNVARQAHEALQEAEMLPRSKEDVDAEAGDPIAEATPWNGIRALLATFALIGALTALFLFFFS
jgi:hypothetical protein